MKNSIEISGKTIGYLLAAVIIMSGLIFFINQYDNNEKLEKVKLTLNELALFNSEEILSVLLKANLDSLTNSEKERVQNNLLQLDTNKALKKVKGYHSFIIVKEGSSAYKLNMQNFGQYRNKHYKGMKFVMPAVLSENEQELIQLFEGENKNVSKLILDQFSFMDSSKIIYPLGQNDSRKVYFSFNISEGR